MHPRAPSRSPTVTSRASPATHQKSRHWHPSSLRSPGRGYPRCSERYSTERRTSEPVSLKSSRCLGVPSPYPLRYPSLPRLAPVHVSASARSCGFVLRGCTIGAECSRGPSAPRGRSFLLSRHRPGIRESFLWCCADTHTSLLEPAARRSAVFVDL